MPDKKHFNLCSSRSRYHAEIRWIRDLLGKTLKEDKGEEQDKVGRLFSGGLKFMKERGERKAR
jgi:hypothetical protein